MRLLWVHYPLDLIVGVTRAVATTLVGSDAK